MGSWWMPTPPFHSASCGKRLPEQLDRPARQGRQAGHVAGSLKREHGLPQRLAILVREGDLGWRGVACSAGRGS